MAAAATTGSSPRSAIITSAVTCCSQREGASPARVKQAGLIFGKDAGRRFGRIFYNVTIELRTEES